MGQEV